MKNLVLSLCTLMISFQASAWLRTTNDYAIAAETLAKGFSCQLRAGSSNCPRTFVSTGNYDGGTGIMFSAGVGRQYLVIQELHDGNTALAQISGVDGAQFTGQYACQVYFQ